MEQQLDRFSYLRHAARTDVGQKRTNNEDAFGVFHDAGIFCVSDGMGGGDDGEVASAATVKAIGEFCEAHPLPKEGTYQIDDLVTGLRYAVDSASAWIYKRAQEHNLKGCGATFVGVCFDASNPTEAVALHAGDSRLYRIRGRSIQQITKDHSAAELIGAKNEKDVNPMFRGMILRAVGIQSSVDVERTPLPVKAGDRILICSDGLSRMVSDKKLLSISRANADIDEAAAAMIAAANDAGGIDNVTAVLIEVGPLPAPLVAVPLPGLPIDDDADISRGGGHPSSDADSSGTADSDSGAGFISSDGIGADESATAANTSATFPSEDSQTRTIATACTESDEPQTITATRDDNHSQTLRAKARRLRRIRFFIRALFVLLLIGVAGNFIFHRKKLAAERQHMLEITKAQQHAQEVAREAEERLAREKAEAERMMLAEKKKAAELDAKRKAAADAAAMETKKAKLEAEQEAEAAREAQRKAEMEKKKADAERKARKKAEEEVAELQEANRRAKEEVAKLQEANRKAKAEAERRAREQAEAKLKAEAEAKPKADNQKDVDKESAERQAVLKELIDVCAPETAGAYAQKLHSLNFDNVLEELPVQFSEIRDAKTSQKRQLELARMITGNVQKSVRQLQSYAATEISGFEEDMKGLDGKRREQLRERMAMRVDFCNEIRSFLEISPDTPEAQRQCVNMIRKIPMWFK